MTKMTSAQRLAKLIASARHAAWVFICMLPDIARRFYALVLGVVVVTLTFLALKYLIVGLLFEHPPPKQITDLPLHADESMLVRAPADWTALRAVENPRTPPAHYHRITSSIQIDPKNDCTRSGCHSPLPHSKRREVRAFLNMHASALHCGVCHFRGEEAPRSLTWYDLSNGASTNPPALLDVYDWLVKSQMRKEFTVEDQAIIATLMREAANQAGGELTLERIAAHLRAIRPSDRSFVHLLEAARGAVERTFRGAYGAKLALRETSGAPMLAHPNTQSEIADYLSRKSQLDETTREALLIAIHPQRREAPLTCSECHRSDGLVDFKSLGYPDARRDTLIDAPIVRMLESIERGQPFHLPELTREENE